MIVFIPSHVALFLMSCFWLFLCYLGNVIVVFVFIGSNVSPFFIVFLILLDPLLGFMKRFHFFTSPFHFFVRFFTFPYDFTFSSHLLV